MEKKDRCMFCIISQGYQKKYQVMLQSFLKYNKGWDIVLFYPGKIDIPGVTQQIDITQDLKGYPNEYSLKYKIWSYRAEATLKCLQKYNNVLYCDSDLMFYDLLPDFQQTTFTLHLLHGFTLQLFDKYCRTGFINTGIYFAKADIQTMHWFEFAKELFKRADLVNTHHRGAQMWDQVLYLYMPWSGFNKYAIDNHDGINVAFWNLHQRKLSKKDGKYFVNEQPLVCFHFSLLGKTAGYAQRDPVLMELYQDYVSRIS